MKALFKNSAIVIAATLMTPFIAGCSDDEGSDDAVKADVGTLGLNLSVAPGENVSVVNYNINHPENGSWSGDIPLGSSPNVSMRIGGLPEGTGYTLVLSGTSDEGGAQCRGEATFDVVAGQVSSVSVVLSCAVDDGIGDIDVNADVNTCPQIYSTTVHPLSAEYGQLINFKALASDADAGDTLTYSWTVDGAEVSTNSTGDWPCAAPQEHKDLVITVSDGECQDSSLIQVWCQAPGVCGNGVIESGEQCDDGNDIDTDSCPNTCLTPVCGDGEITGDEECDSEDRDVCTADCKSVVVECGDGNKHPSEACDYDAATDPDGTAECNTDCTLRAPECGDDWITPPETCEVGDDRCDPVTCQAIPWDWRNEACTECADQTCNVFGDPAITPLCPTTDAACRSVADCMIQESCVDPVIGAAPCYCGSLDQSECWKDGNEGVHDGACVDEVRAAFPGKLPSQIALEFVDPTKGPGGEAGHSINCLAQFCYDDCFQ